MSEHSDRLARGDWYLDDDELRRRRSHCARLVDVFNAVPGGDYAGRRRALEDLVEVAAAGALVVPRFQCTYGVNITLGQDSFVNANSFFMDDATITIGDDVRIGPGAQLMTALHPIEDHHRRREGWEQALPIVIEDNAWLGASVIVGAGVKIGRNAVIGAGSVVLRDIPDHVVAVGSPARVIRSLPREGGGHTE